MSDRVRTSPMGSSPRKLVFYPLMIVLVWAVVEIAAVAGHAVLDGRMFSPRSVREQVRAVAEHESSATRPTAPNEALTSGQSAASWSDAIHPYVGVVADPDRNHAGLVSDLGFVAGPSAAALRQPDPDTTVVGIFGGSFAAAVAGHFFRDDSKIGDRKMVTANFAKGGYKQPQQLMILAYLLALGAQLDVVVNLDGFNEVALPPVENVARGVNPFYPRQWHMKTQGLLEPEMVRNVGHLRYLEAERSRRASWLLERGLYRSAVLSLVWRATDRRLATRVVDARGVVDRTEAGQVSFKLVRRPMRCLTTVGVPREVASSLRPLRDQSFDRQDQLHQAVVSNIGDDLATKHRRSIEKCTAKLSDSFTALGPKHAISSDEELYQDLAEMWQRSSFEMKVLCEAHGIRYFHFLQPNQYVTGSKPMTSGEERIAINAAQAYRQGVAQGYPLLRTLGRELIDRGVAFTDLTMLFEHNSEVLYADDCCHLNEKGYGAVFHKILETIAADA